MKKIRINYAILLLIILLPLGAKGVAESETPEKPIIAVSIVPQQYVVDRIAGNLVDTVVLVGPGQNPHSYEPTPRQMAMFSQAFAWITSGTDFEIALIPKITSMYPNLLVVDGTEGVILRTLEEHDSDHEDEEHHDAEEPHFGNIDRHTWLGSEPMKIMANHVAKTLTQADAKNTGIYEKNLQDFITEIDELFVQLTETLSPLKGTTVLVYHPSFGYLLDEFEIHQKAVETGGKEPTAKNLSQLISEAKEERIPAIFVQAQFPVTAAQNIAKSIGAEVLPLDPLAYDWIKNIQEIGNTLQVALMNQDKGENP